MGDTINKVHFYVTRDKDGTLVLWFGRPIRESTWWGIDYSQKNLAMAYNGGLSEYSLDVNDYKDLGWEDDPVEVFIDMDNKRTKNDKS